jgi:hypothetical protein
LKNLKVFKKKIDRTFVFSSSSELFEATNIPAWLMSTPLNINPTFKGSYETPGSSDGVAVSENYAYVADGASGLQIIDISDPSNPTFKGSYVTLDEISGVIVSGNYAYVEKHASGLQIVDVSDPANPTFKGSYDMLSGVGGVAVSGNYAYAAAYGSLQIVDISDPSNPTFKSSYNAHRVSGIYEVAVFGNYACVADLWGSLEIVDIKNSSNPTFRGSSRTPYSASGIVLSENYAYVADGYSGLQIIDITNPSKPTSKGSCMSGMIYAHEVALSGNSVYVVSDSGLHIIDITNPSNPTLRDSYNMPGRAYGVAVSGNYVYVAIGGLHVVALNPDKLMLSGTPKLAGTHRVDIKACNRAEECVSDSFNIIVKNFLSTSTEIDFTSTIISSMIAGTFAACIASLFLPLIIGGGIVMLRRRRNKILGSEGSTKVKELKEAEELKESKISEDKKIVVGEKLIQPIEKKLRLRRSEAIVLDNL